MWGTLLSVISGLWLIGAVYFLYAFGTGLFTWQWKHFLIAFLVMIFLTIAAIVAAVKTPRK